MKKTLLICLVAVLVLSMSFTACSDQNASSSDAEMRIVTTIFPPYDWTREILGEHAEKADLTLLLDSGIDLHSYQPTVEDIALISDCDLFIYVGGVSDAWVEDALKNATNKDMIAINLLDVLGDAVKQEVIKEGMEDTHDHDSDVHDDHDHDHDSAGHDHKDGTHEHEDEHVWLSLKNAQLLCSRIATELGNLDPENANAYENNAKSYILQLAALHTEYETMVADAATKTLLFGDRFPFRYLIDDYDLDYYAAFSGCSAETEAGFETIRFLANKTDALGLKSVLVTESSDKLIAQTVIQNTGEKNQKIIVLDSMQSITPSDISSGTTYLSVMENNLKALKDALY